MNTRNIKIIIIERYILIIEINWYKEKKSTNFIQTCSDLSFLEDRTFTCLIKLIFNQTGPRDQRQYRIPTANSPKLSKTGILYSQSDKPGYTAAIKGELKWSSTPGVSTSHYCH